VQRLRTTPVASPVVISSFVSPATRSFLRGCDVGFIDLAGNICVALAVPGLCIDVSGAAENPEKDDRTGSLKGPKAGRVVRCLVEQRSPPGVRELADKAGVDAGYVSRLFAFLDEQALITRVGHGRVERVAWPQLLERWATDAPLLSRGRLATFIEPRGTNAILEKLRATSRRYGITGSFAAARIAPVASPRLLTVYTDDIAGLVGETHLRPTTSGANVLLIEPVDVDMVRGLKLDNGLWYAALPQVVVDLLDGPGRSPAEAEALVAWMKQHEEVWRG
jgi:hypothetical protein